MRRLGPRVVICDFPGIWYPNFPYFLPRGVTVAQVTLDHFVMVRIHARQVVPNEQLTLEFERILNDVLGHFYRSELIFY
jgi:hypothetical protein